MWNDNWRKELELNDYDCYLRLCECRNTKQDILVMAKLLYKYNPTFESDDCLDRICEWVCCWNNQFECELTEKEYIDFLQKI